MSDTEEATINPDGSTTFETPPVNETAEEGAGEGFGGDAGFDGTEKEGFDVPPGAGGEDEDVMETAAKGIDPAVYLLAVVALVAILYYVFVLRKKNLEQEDDFFSNLDGDKFNLELPSEVDEYYQIKEKCEEAGWKPGEAPAGPPGQAPNAQGPQRVIAQALMKRAVADIPIVQHIQKESGGMNKLYSQSMCSVKQWRAYQAAEALVSSEVADVRAEADEIEPGWSQVIWRQAMQYHQMIKQKHEMETKAAAEQAKKKKEAEDKVMAEKRKIDEAKAREMAAEKAAQDLIKAEEREKQSKKSFSGKGMKKGFLDSKGKKK